MVLLKMSNLVCLLGQSCSVCVKECNDGRVKRSNYVYLMSLFLFVSIVRLQSIANRSIEQSVTWWYAPSCSEVFSVCKDDRGANTSSMSRPHVRGRWRGCKIVIDNKFKS